MCNKCTTICQYPTAISAYPVPLTAECELHPTSDIALEHVSTRHFISVGEMNINHRSSCVLDLYIAEIRHLDDTPYEDALTFTSGRLREKPYIACRALRYIQ